LVAAVFVIAKETVVNFFTCVGFPINFLPAILLMYPVNFSKANFIEKERLQVVDIGIYRTIIWKSII